MPVIHSLCILLCMSEQPNAGIPEWTMGDRLGKALSVAGMKVADMAAYLGVSRNTVGNYINDRTPIPGPAFRLWVLRTGVSKEWIETGIGSSSTPTPPPGKPGDLERLTEKKRGRTRGASDRDNNDRYLDAA